MLTLKQIYDNKAAIIAGLEKKHFANATETIDQVIALDTERKAAQQKKKGWRKADSSISAICFKLCFDIIRVEPINHI